MASSQKPRKFATRVARVAVFSAGLGGLAAAAVAIFAVDRLLASHADQRLRAATVTLAGELDEERDDKNADNVAETVADENGEIVTSGIRLSVFEHGARLAGDAWAFAPPADRCQTDLVAGQRVRACATSHGTRVLVAAQPIDESWLHWLYALAALGAVALGAGIGALSSFALARWATAPLVTLSRALGAVSAEAPGAADLGPPGVYEEVEALRAALQELSQRLQAQLEQAQRFAADAAHEIRTPLAALRAELELLAEERSSSEAAPLERACERVQRLSELVERLLVLAVPSEKLSQGFETLAVADLVEDAIAELAPAQRARIRTELAGEGLAWGDPRLLTSLIENALQNSLKFAPAGIVTVRLVQAAELELHVEDSGSGVSPELAARVFEPFYRAAPGAASGHGLGLSLIAHIARAHGGRARFENAARGAHLVVSLPLWRPSDVLSG